MSQPAHHRNKTTSQQSGTSATDSAALESATLFQPELRFKAAPAEGAQRIFACRRQPIEYTSGQRQVLDLVAGLFMSERGFAELRIGGYAGTGKTTIVENMLRFAGELGLRAAVLAPTNKAVQVLRGKMPDLLGQQNSRTIHAVLYGAPDARGDFKIGRPNPLRAVGDIIIVDEGSMLPQLILQDIRKVCREERLKLVIMGDDFQLEAVEDKHTPVRQSRPLENPDVLLTEVRRQSNTSEVLKLATIMRVHGRPFLPSEDSGALRLFRSEPALRYEELFKAHDGDVVYIVGSNAMRVAANQQIRKCLYNKAAEKLALIGGESLISISNSAYHTNGSMFRAGNVSAYRGHGYAEVLLSGEERTVREFFMCFDIKEKGPHGRPLTVLLFPRTQLPSIHKGSLKLPENFPKEILAEAVTATYGYAISCHKSQGSQWRAVMYSPEGAFLMNPRWHYTALTRAASEVHVDMRRPEVYAQAGQLVSPEFIHGEFLKATV